MRLGSVSWCIHWEDQLIGSKVTQNHYMGSRCLISIGASGAVQGLTGTADIGLQ